MKESLTVFIIGAGAREHALSCAYERSANVKKIIVAPGNDFIGWRREKEVIVDKESSLKNPESFLRIARKYKADLVDVAQDDALAFGTTDLLERNGFRVFGPTQEAAKIEWDKKWSREFMQRHEIPSPSFRYFDTEETGGNYVQEIYAKNPLAFLYVKAAGLCAGKGALETRSLEQALRNIKRMGAFSNGAGKIYLIEEGLVGEEFSYYAVCDGKNYRIFKSAQDHKTAFNFDEGEQTGGMGVVSPSFITKGLEEEIERELIGKAVRGMAQEGVPYRGILYVGGIVVDGKPVNIEYNARWGDPECQAVLPALKNDYVDVVFACLDGELNEITLEEDEKTRICVVGVSRGYPGNYEEVKEKEIYGIEKAFEIEGVKIFGAGIDVRDNKFYANGGRLFSVVAEGNNVLEARQRTYAAIAHIYIEGNNLHYRTDIGWREIERFLQETYPRV